MNFAVGTQAGMASGSGRPCPYEPQLHLAPVVDLIIFSLESITIHRYSHTVAGVQLLALLHYIELQFRYSRPIHVTVVNPCLCMASAYDLSCVLKFVVKFVKNFVPNFFLAVLRPVHVAKPVAATLLIAVFLTYWLTFPDPLQVSIAPQRSPAKQHSLH